MASNQSSICTGCDEPAPTLIARGLCSACYQYCRYHNIEMPDRTKKTFDEWWDLTDKPAEGCWLWPGKLTRQGYGITSVDCSPKSSHVVSYQRFVGPIRDKLAIDHVCHNQDLGCKGGDGDPHRACVRPDHLEAVTTAVNNARRAHNMGRGNARKTHCPKGHAYDKVNTYQWRNRRWCRSCRSEARP